MQITNKAQSARGFSVADGSTVVLAPGETRDVTLPEKRGAVLTAWIEGGELVVGEKPAPKPPVKD